MLLQLPTTQEVSNMDEASSYDKHPGVVQARKRYANKIAMVKRKAAAKHAERSSNTTSKAQHNAAAAAIATQKGEYDGGKKDGAINRMALMKQKDLKSIVKKKVDEAFSKGTRPKKVQPKPQNLDGMWDKGPIHPNLFNILGHHGKDATHMFSSDKGFSVKFKTPKKAHELEAKMKAGGAHHFVHAHDDEDPNNKIFHFRESVEYEGETLDEISREALKDYRSKARTDDTDASIKDMKNAEYKRFWKKDADDADEVKNRMKKRRRGIDLVKKKLGEATDKYGRVEQPKEEPRKDHVYWPIKVPTGGGKGIIRHIGMHKDASRKDAMKRAMETVANLTADHAHKLMAMKPVANKPPTYRNVKEETLDESTGITNAHHDAVIRSLKQQAAAHKGQDKEDFEGAHKWLSKNRSQSELKNVMNDGLTRGDTYTREIYGEIAKKHFGMDGAEKHFKVKFHRHKQPDHNKVNEETLDELSRKTLKNYKDKADDQIYHSMDYDNETDDQKSRRYKREAGYRLAHNKLRKKDRAEKKALTKEETTTGVNEALTLTQRRKMAISFRKNKSKIKIGRERAKKRTASKDVLMKRARKHARNMLIKKMTKGNKKDLDFSRREAIEKRLGKMKSKIDQIARKMFPALRKKEMSRDRSG